MDNNNNNNNNNSLYFQRVTHLPEIQGPLFTVQLNLDYSKCQGPPDFLRIIGSSNFQNRYFSKMFGSFRSVLIFDCISIKNGEQGIISYL